MSNEFKGRRALVTGGSRGIGAAICENLDRLGAEVIVVGKGQYSGKFQFLRSDLSDSRNTDDLASKIQSMEIEILINNAGINRINFTNAIEDTEWLEVLSVNLTAPMRLTRAVLPHMIKKNFGRIVNVSSIFGTVSKAKRATYSTTKSGLEGYTRALALDFAKNNILANCIAPGFIDTELTREILKPAELESLIGQVPVGRLGTPQEIAEAVAFLASPRNTFITGQTLVADGGFTIS